MKLDVKKIVAILFLTGTVTTVDADVCRVIPGSITCGQGITDTLSGYGVVKVKDTTVLGKTLVNGILNAKEANFFSLDVNGSAKLTHCTINDVASIKGSLTASSTQFKKNLKIYSSQTRFINSKVNNDLHVGHTDSGKQVIYLDNFSEVSGDIIFDDGDGEVFVRGQSKIGGKIVGGKQLKVIS